MDNEYPKDQESSAPGRERLDASVSRRRFTRAGLGGSIVLASLASKPVLGQSLPAVNCTVSGQISGNLSRPDLADGACISGNPPSTWLSATTWPTPLFDKGTLPNQNCNFSKKGTVFNGFTPGGGVPPLADTFFNEGTGSGNTQACSIITSETDNPTTMLQVLSSMGVNDDLYLGGVVVASLLNATSFGISYPVTAHTIIAMFNATIIPGGEYPVASGKSWSRARVIEYLESLYQ